MFIWLLINTNQLFMNLELHLQNIIHSYFMKYTHKNNLRKIVKNQKHLLSVGNK